MDRMGEKSARNLLAGLEASKKRPLSSLLAALGIRYVGTRVAELLAGHFGHMDRLKEASEEELAGIDGVGPVIASSVEAFFREPANRDLLCRLRERGLNFVGEEKNGEGGGDSNTHCFVKKEYLINENEKAKRAEITRDCRLGCTGCGMNEKTVCKIG